MDWIQIYSAMLFAVHHFAMLRHMKPRWTYVAAYVFLFAAYAPVFGRAMGVF